MFSCQLCNFSNEYCYTSRYCSKCQRIKHYLNLYGDRVFEVLDSVLSREEFKQNNKIKQEIKKEIENHKMKLTEDDTYEKKPKTRSCTKKE